jgi:hypothetical protein
MLGVCKLPIFGLLASFLERSIKLNPGLFFIFFWSLYQHEKRDGLECGQFFGYQFFFIRTGIGPIKISKLKLLDFS